MNRHIVAGAVLLALTSGHLFAQERYSVGIGADYSNGDYGTGSTATLVSLPLSLAYQGKGWGWGVSVSYLSLRSSGNVVVGAGGMIGTGAAATGSSGGGSGPGGGGGGTTSSTTTESGLGDTNLRFSLELAEEGEVMPWLGLTFKAKLATADETRKLGTGENDYAAQLEMAKGHVDGYLGYKVLGDTSSIDYRNVGYGALAFSIESSEETRYSLEAYLEQPAISGKDPKREVSVILDHWLDDEKMVSSYVMKGFSDASPDWGAGLSLKHTF